MEEPEAEKEEEEKKVEEESGEGREGGAGKGCYKVEELMKSWSGRQKEEFQLFREKFERLRKEEMGGVVEALVTGHFAEYEGHYREES